MFGAVTTLGGILIVLLMGAPGIPVVIIGILILVYALKLLSDDLKRLK